MEASSQPSGINRQINQLRWGGGTSSVRADTGFRSPSCSCGHESAALSPADVMPTHDLQEAGVIGEAERLRRPGDVPVVVLERRDDDLALGLRPEGMERGWGAAGGGAL